MQLSIDIERVLAETFVAKAEYHRVVGSTNDRAKELATEKQSQLPLLIIADRQTAGRGRGTNRWWTGQGNLALSLLLNLEQVSGSPGHLPMVALAVGIAVVETVRPLVRQPPLGIHWPNDVFVGTRKLAGVLVEVPRRPYAVIGVGLNVNAPTDDAPKELRERITSLKELTGDAQDRSGLLISFLQKLEAELQGMGEDVSAVAGRADRLCLQRGRQLTVRTGTRTVQGRCAGIGPDGALLLDTATGPQRCYSGTVEAGGAGDRGVR